MTKKIVILCGTLLTAVAIFAAGLRLGVNLGYEHYEVANSAHKSFEIVQVLLALRSGRTNDVESSLEQRLSYYIAVHESGPGKPYVSSLLDRDLQFGLANPTELRCISAYRRVFPMRPSRIQSGPGVTEQATLVERFVSLHSSDRDPSAECEALNVPPS